MTVGEVVDWVLRLCVVLGIPSVVVYFLKERRKNQAESAVAERTVDSTVEKVNLSTLEAHMLAVEATFTMERASKDRRIAALQEELTSARAEVAEAKATVERLEYRLTEALGRIEQLEKERDAA